MTWAKKEIESKKIFKQVIYPLLIKLSNLKKYRKNGLSTDVNSLYDELNEVYGNDYSEQDEKYSTDDLSYSSKTYGSRIPHYIWSKEGGRFSIRDIIEFCFIVLLFSFILFVIFFSPLLPYLNKQFGDLGVILFLIFILIIFAVVNIIYRKKYRK